MKNKTYESIWKDIQDSGWMQDFIQNIINKVDQPKVSNTISALKLISENDFSLNKDASDLNTVMSELKKYMDLAVNTQSPYFINQLYGGAHPIAVISEWVGAFMNTSMATYEIAPVATMYEKEILKSLAQLMSWETHDGIMVPGGSYANMMAMHLSRFIKNPKSKTEGHTHKHVVYVSDQAHYSMKKAAHLLGYGEQQVRIVPSDQYFKMDVLKLESLIIEDLKLGFEPTVVVSTLGTTVFGAIDPMIEIQQVCSRYRIWHHVDGAWGGPLVFSVKTIQEALKNVDSVTFDFHKLLGGTLTKALFITQKENLLSEANSCAGTQYIFHEDEDSFFDTGTKAIQCGRKVDALSLWMTWKFLGTEGFKSYVDDLMALRFEGLNLIKKYNFESLNDPEYLNLCFKVPVPKYLSGVDINSFQKMLRKVLMKEGHVYVNYSSSEKQGVFIRLVLSHLRLNSLVLEDIFKIINETALSLNTTKVVGSAESDLENQSVI